MKQLFREIMILSIVGVAFLMIASANAAEKPQRPGEGRNFEEVKLEILKNIDLRIAGMKKGRKCIAAAEDHKALTACRKAHMDEMKKMRKGKPGRRSMGDESNTDPLPKNIFRIK